MRVLIVAGLPNDRLVHDRTKGECFAAFPKPFNPKQPNREKSKTWVV